MNPLRDTVWQRRGISWIWDPTALSRVAKPGEVVGVREWVRMAGQWPEDLPSNSGGALVVAGLDACLDLLAPGDADRWLSSEVKGNILSFQDAYDSDAALVFWLPSGKRRLQVHPASDDVSWRCSAPSLGSTLDFGRLLWGEAREYPQEIVLAQGAAVSGLFHLRIT